MGVPSAASVSQQAWLAAVPPSAAGRPRGPVNVKPHPSAHPSVGVAPASAGEMRSFWFHLGILFE